MIPFLIYGSMAFGAMILGIENSFVVVDELSLDMVHLGLWQYVVGSFTFAAAAGVAVFVLAFLIMTLFKRKSYRE
jgi:uncharacterized protein (DUF2062 family)